MTAKTDLINMVFGKLVVIGRAESTKSGRAQWVCSCACGNTVTALGKRLLNGEKKSCGCARIDACKTNSIKNITHGMSKTPTWNSWMSMKERCLNQNAHGYEYYGARGITICPRWHKFENFLADMGERPVGLTIDRIDTNGNYEPGNCRWASWKQQANNKRNNRRFNGKTVAEIADELGTNYVTTRKRLIKAERNITIRPVGLPVVGQAELFK